jgi:hypothetical protein
VLAVAVRDEDDAARVVGGPAVDIGSHERHPRRT